MKSILKEKWWKIIANNHSLLEIFTNVLKLCTA